MYYGDLDAETQNSTRENKRKENNLDPKSTKKELAIKRTIDETITKHVACNLEKHRIDNKILQLTSNRNVDGGGTEVRYCPVSRVV